MKSIFIVVLIALSTMVYGGKYSDPQPTFDKPREIFMKLNSSDVEKANHLLGTIYNLLKDYPAETLKVAVITYGPGMRILLKSGDKRTKSRIESLMEYDVEFIGCRNTMATMKWTQKDFLDDISYVQAGLTEVIERQVGGWIDATPY